jgi:hypothetical protein
MATTVNPVPNTGANIVTSLTGPELFEFTNLGSQTPKQINAQNAKGFFASSTVLTIATLPGASGATGARYLVSNGTTAGGWMSAVSATGAAMVPVISDGTVWRYG